jgi:hypothetical protein
VLVAVKVECYARNIIFFSALFFSDRHNYIVPFCIQSKLQAGREPILQKYFVE